MKNSLLIRLVVCVFSVLFSQISFAQLPDGFDIKKAYQQAKDKGIVASDVEGYVRFLHNDFLSHKGHSNVSSSANASKKTGVYNAGTIYLGGGNVNPYANKPINPNFPSPQNVYCPNAGFEQATFANWTGSYGTVVTGAAGSGFPTYTQTSPTIVNSAGNDVSLINTVNYHTIMTTPATNSVYPNCVGYDSIACKVVGTQTVSEIPVVNPNGGPASVRLNGANANYRASKLTYNMSLNPNNKNFSISYALVLDNGGHTAEEQPYFSVKVTDQNGTLVPGCSTYTVTCSAALTDTNSPLYDPTWTDAAMGWGSIMYRKWTSYAFDFSNYPAITSVNVEFYVGGCSQGGHYGYAYVDAACSPGGAVASFCANNNQAVLNAPTGYLTYQWLGPLGPISVPNGGNASTATITPVSAGQVFTCNVTSQNGCNSSFQTTVAISSVSITGVGSTPSCPNGNSGTANVSATGSSSGYNYQWVNSVGTTVSTAQTATGLSPGIYTVNVTAVLCGAQSTTVQVGISAPTFYSIAAPYCGTTAWITNAGGSNYKWYTASPLALIAGATSSSLTINSPVNGAGYFLVFTTASGCKDSIKYILSQSPGGSIYTSNIKSICPGNNNSYAVINLQTAAPPVYSYSVTGPGGYSSILNNTTLIKDSITGLSIGTYSATVFDGQCLYTTTFTVNPFLFSYTLTPTTSTICVPGTASLSVNFGNTTPSTCGLSTTGGCTSPNLITIGTGVATNGSTDYPAIYGNFYNNTRHQILYLASELTAAGMLPGKISSLAFNITTINGISTYPNFTIKVKCTSVNDLTSSTFDNTGLVQVYFAASQNITTGWNTYPFATAYEWDGVSNLLIDVCDGLTSSYTNNSSSPYTITPFNSVRWFNNDVTPACMTTNLANVYTPNTTYRPNIKFGNCGGSNPSAFTYSWSAAAGLSSTNTVSTIASPASTTVYTVEVSPIGQTNCMQAQTTTVTVINPVPATITPVSPLCTNASTLALSVIPTGGSWSGPGVTPSGILTPSLCVVGSNTYSYSVGTGSCSIYANTSISVEQFVPSTISGTINPICITNPTINLATALSTSTLGVGTWSGAGVTGTTFDPVVSGAGLITLTYNTNSNPTATLCPSASTIAISVNSAVQPTITPAGPYCDNFIGQQMIANPTGGVWSAANVGPSITGAGVFSPSSSLIGSNKIYYTITSAPCVKRDSALIDVVHFVPATITGTVGPFCIYDAATNLQAIAQFTGGVWSGNGVSGTMFTPATALAGTSVATYSTDPAPSGLCPDTKTVSILVNDKPEANAVASNFGGCNYPWTVDFSTTTVNTGQAIWNFGDGTPNDTGLVVSHVFTTPGTYTATIYYTDNIGCKDTTQALTAVTIFSVPVAAFEPSLDITTVIDAEITFNNQTSDLLNNTYTWDFGGLDNSTDISPLYLFTNSGEFFITLIATSPDNCQDTAVKKVTINPDVVLYVPNAFTPGNNDGLNDVFQIFLPPTGVDFSTFDLKIYDRWGELIYRTNDVNVFWTGAKNNSGQIMKQDVYVWKITFMDTKKKYYEKLGHVSLLRK